VHDITPFVKTKEEYDALPVNTGTFNKENTLTYNIGGSTLENFGTDTGAQGISNVLANIIDVIRSTDTYLFDRDPDGKSINFTKLVESVNDSVLITVLYTPTASLVNISQAKENIDEIGVYSEFLSNQDDNAIAMDSFGNKLEAQAKRLGNTESITVENITSINDIKQVGDYDDFGVITDVDVIINTDYYNVKYTWTKGFNRINEFIGVDSRPRPFDTPLNNTITRMETINEYVEFATTEKTSTTSYLSSNS
jgi:hypothetical protein